MKIKKSISASFLVGGNRPYKMAHILMQIRQCGSYQGVKKEA